MASALALCPPPVSDIKTSILFLPLLFAFSAMELPVQLLNLPAVSNHMLEAFSRAISQCTFAFEGPETTRLHSTKSTILQQQQLRLSCKA